MSLLAAHATLAALHSLVTSFFSTVQATTEIYTLSLHDALPISSALIAVVRPAPERPVTMRTRGARWPCAAVLASSRVSEGGSRPFCPVSALAPWVRPTVFGSPGSAVPGRMEG